MREKKQASETMLQNLYKHCMEAKVVDGGRWQRARDDYTQIKDNLVIHETMSLDPGLKNQVGAELMKMWRNSIYLLLPGV